MKKSIGIFFLGLLFLAFTSCSSDDDSSSSTAENVLDVENCDELVYERYEDVIEMAILFGQIQSQENCNKVKQAAVSYKEAMIECDYWDEETESSKAEIEDIIDLDC
ncbi:MAG: hypothetical protein ACQESK_00555 [Bacteroidota bacterium]